MQRLTVFAFREDADSIVRRLMNLRCVEVRVADPERGAAVLPYLNAEAELAEHGKRLDVIREALPILAKYATRKKGLARRVLHANRAEFVRDGRAEQAFGIAERAIATSEQLRKNLEEQTRLQNLLEQLSPWSELDVPLNAMRTARTVTVPGVFPPSSSPEDLEERLSEAGIAADFVSEEKSGWYYTVSYLLPEEQEAQRTLTECGFLKADLPEEDELPVAAVERLARAVEHLENEYLNTEERLWDLAEQKDGVEILSDIEETALIAAKLKQKLAKTGHCVVLDGWIPTSMEKVVSEALEAYSCAYELEEPTEEDEVPVLLHNNSFAANFEWVIGMYSYPRYGTYDPTFIMSIFYFIIFGLMFADFGYGILMAVLCFLAAKFLNPRAGMKRMMLMFGYCGVSSAVMGAIFGGWFGDLPTAVMSNILHVPVDSAVGHFFGNGLWFNPLDDPMKYLIVSLAIGAIHIVTGMAIQFVLLCRNGQPLEAICTILPYWVLFAGLGLFLVDGAIAKWVALAGALLILLLNGYGQKGFFGRLIKGLGGLYGLINYGSDLLSYSRILALGMVAGVIAKVINMITALGSGGPIGFILMLLILILGHALNIGINILGTFVHTARLQYIEFFGKFFEEGGEPFRPALPAEQYSEDDEPAKTNSGSI